MDIIPKEDIKWKFQKIIIFLKYVTWEPFRQFVKPRAWMYIFLVIFLVTLIRGKKLEQFISFIILILLMLWTEWESGRFMEYYRRNYGKYYKKS